MYLSTVLDMLLVVVYKLSEMVCFNRTIAISVPALSKETDDEV